MVKFNGRIKRTEFKVLMYQHGKWKSGYAPFCPRIPVEDTLEKAVRKRDDAEKRWASTSYKKDIPTAWKIVCREVVETEWVEVKGGD